jgi:hypothetical protein
MENRRGSDEDLANPFHVATIARWWIVEPGITDIHPPPGGGGYLAKANLRKLFT